MIFRRACIALLLTLVCGMSASIAQATPVATARVGGRGLVLTVTAFVRGTLPGCEVSTPEAGARSGYTVVARDDAAGWALVRHSAEGQAGGASVGRPVAIDTPGPGHPITITWGEGSATARAEAFMGRATSTTIELRLLPHGPHETPAAPRVPEGAAVIDGMDRLLGVVITTDEDRVLVVPGVLALAEIRDAGVHAPPVCRTAEAHGGQYPVIRMPRAPTDACASGPVEVLPDVLRARARAAVRWDHATVLGVAVMGDGWMVSPSSVAATVRRGCVGAVGSSPSVRGEVVTVDASTGLALMRMESPGTQGGLPLAGAPARCDRVTFLVDGNGGTVGGSVVHAGSSDLRVHLVGPGTVPDGSPALDAEGALLGLASLSANGDVLISPVGALAQSFALAGAPSPACGEPGAMATPTLGTQDVESLGDPLGSLATHVGTDSVYATLGDRLSDVAVGCVIRRTDRPDDEVLDVDAVGNVGVFHPLNRYRSQLPLTIAGEQPPLRLVDERPANGTDVWVALAPGPGVPVHATVLRGAGDEIIVGGAPANTPHGAPVLDGAGRLVALMDRPLADGVHLARSASILRRMLTRLRRNDATPGCSGAYGMGPGPVVAFNLLAGFRIATPADARVHFPLAVGVLWYNTWWARGELGFAFPNDALSVVAAGGPLVYRSAGDGEVGIGAHLEFELPLTTSQDTVGSPNAVRALYGFEVEASPYVSNSVGLMFSLALGLSQHGDYTQGHFGFGTTFMLGASFGSLRRDRP